MRQYVETIRERARELLGSGRVEVFIGYRKGTVPMMNQPILIREPEDAALLYWDSSCGLNLCNYLTKRTDKVGIVANGCNSRNIVTHILENQIQRERLYILGIPCTGMIDHRGVERTVHPREIVDVEDEGDLFRVTGKDFRETFKKKDFLRTNCAVCEHRNPVLFDEMVAEPVEEQKDVQAYHDVESVERMTSEKRWAFFSQLISKCVRCYACRNACPLCYCPICFVDESRPQWVGKGTDPTDTMTFHVLRAYHCAGRCTDCGACERVCPVGISMRQLTRKLNKDAETYFGWKAGLRLEERPLLDVYKPEDPNDFIR